MTNLNNQPAAENVCAILEGGPRDLPDTVRTAQITADRQKIKIPHRGGYEHFERHTDAATCPNHPNQRRLVFRWTDRTAVAE